MPSPRLFDEDAEDPMFNGFVDAICTAEAAAEKLIDPYQRAMAWAAIAAAYAPNV